MPYKDLTFLLFAKDVSAGAAFGKLTAEADAASVGIGRSMGGLGVVAAGAGIAVTAAAVKMAADFQTATTRLVTDAGESQSNLESVRQGILTISQQVGIGATDLAKGAYYVESAGYHGAAALTTLKAAAEGAKIGGADLVTVADALTTVMKDYGPAAGTAAQATSSLIATVSRGKTTMELLAGSLHSVLPNAEALGISLDQVLGAVATMTQEGISADQATQNLNHTIVSLANPTQVQTKAMAALGLSSVDVAKNLGKRGLTGTLDLLVTAITSHMGKAGLVLQNTFATSKVAAQSADTEFKALPKNVQTLARAYEQGSITSKTWTASLKDMPPLQANLARQWAVTENRAKGFSQALRSGSGPAKTFTSELSQMTGGQTGLQVALHLSGIHSKDFAENVKEIGKAAKGTKGEVRDWDKIQSTTNQQLSQAGAAAGAYGIKVGTVLLPAVGKLAGVLAHGIDGFSKMSDVVSGSSTSFNIFISQGLQRAASAVNKYMSGMVSGVSSNVSRIIGAVRSYVGGMQAAGAALIQGFAHGIASAVGAAVSAAHGVMNAVSRLFPHSPAPEGAFSGRGWTLYSGQAVGRDFAVGMAGTATGAATSASKVAAAAAREFGVALTGFARLADEKSKTSKQLAAAKSALSSSKSDSKQLVNDLTTSTIGAGDISGKSTTGDMVEGLSTLLSNTRRFKGDLQSLARLGIDKTSLKQLVVGWQSDPAAAVAAADQLVANPMDLREIVQLQSQVASAASGLAGYASGLEYGSATRADQRKVDTLTHRKQHLESQMSHAAGRVNRDAHQLHVHLHLTGHYAGDKRDLAKTVTTAIKDAVKQGHLPKNVLTSL